jgi:hypothetical protein
MEDTAALAKSVPPVDRQTKKKGADLGPHSVAVRHLQKMRFGATQKLACTFGA